MVCTSSLSAVVGFLDQDYRYKSVTLQISADAKLAPVRPVGYRTWDRYKREKEREVGRVSEGGKEREECRERAVENEREGERLRGRGKRDIESNCPNM